RFYLVLGHGSHDPGSRCGRPPSRSWKASAKRERLTARGPLPSFVGTMSQAIDLIRQYQDAGVDLLIYSDPRNDVETRELFVWDVMPHFCLTGGLRDSGKGRIIERRGGLGR